VKILLLGSGGREHSLAWKLAQSPRFETLFCAPGNAGISEVATCVEIDINAPQAVLAFCQIQAVDFVVVGPEAPLVTGVTDILRANNIAVFGASKAAAQLESSKTFTKQVCDARHIPTAAYADFDNLDDASTYLQSQSMPIVIKADGLAAGKGVVIAQTHAEAQDAVKNVFDGAFGADSGTRVVIEEFMQGEEVSFFVISDGETAVPLASAQDHKRAFDGDTGPNTGGMGAYSPAEIFTPELQQEVMDKIIHPTLAEMAERGTPFQGVLYAGLMLTTEGPRLVEYNVRFGDPECQVLMLRLESDLVDLLYAAATKNLSHITSPKWSDETAITVVMATQGYPGSYEKGSRIKLGQSMENVQVFHAGTKYEGGTLTAVGGRVLNVCATGKTVAEARDRAYERINAIEWPEGFYRKDIAWRRLS
jgi:phosphoribosylamine--glycine ligase